MHARRVQPHDAVNIMLRECLAADIPQVNALFTEAYGAYPYPLRWEDMPHGLYLVAEHGSSIVGFARVTPYQSYPGVWEFGGLVVKPAYQGLRLAQRLTIGRLARIQGRKDAHIFVCEATCYNPTNAPQNNCIKHGFRPLGIQPFKYPGLDIQGLLGAPLSVIMAVQSKLPDAALGRRKLLLSAKASEFLLALGIPAATNLGVVFDDEMPEPRSYEHTSSDGTPGSTFVDIAANWSHSAAVMEEWQTLGFLPCALLPGFGKRQDGSRYDLVRFYKPFAARPFSSISVAARLLPTKKLMEDQLLAR